MRQYRLFLFLIFPIFVSAASAGLIKTSNENQAAALKSKSPSPRWTKQDETVLLAKAQGGDANSQMWLGAAYEQGWFGFTDFAAALQWFRRSAEQGNPDAENSLGQMYEDGEGVAESCAVAAKWYRKAAEHVPDLGGAGQGRNNLGMLYLRGCGVPKDYVQAYMWFKLSASPGLSDATTHMTSEQIAEAERLAARWITQHSQPNDTDF